MNSSKPKLLAGETSKEFRLRAILWVLDRYQKSSYQEITDRYNRLFPKSKTTKETVIRSVKILHQRRNVRAAHNPNNNRELLWSVA